MGENITNGDIYINKQSPLVTRSSADSQPLGPNQTLPDSAYRPTPQSYKGPPGEACVVDRVLLTNNDDSFMTIKVCLCCHLYVRHLLNSCAVHQPGNWVR